MEVVFLASGMSRVRPEPAVGVGTSQKYTMAPLLQSEVTVKDSSEGKSSQRAAYPSSGKREVSQEKNIYGVIGRGKQLGSLVRSLKEERLVDQRWGDLQSRNVNRNAGAGTKSKDLSITSNTQQREAPNNQGRQNSAPAL